MGHLQMRNLQSQYTVHALIDIKKTDLRTSVMLMTLGPSITSGSDCAKITILWAWLQPGQFYKRANIHNQHSHMQAVQTQPNPHGSRFEICPAQILTDAYRCIAIAT